MSPSPSTPLRSEASYDRDRVLVIGGSTDTLDLLRLATIRSDNVVLIAETLDQRTLHYAERFAIEHDQRAWTEADMEGATTVLASTLPVEIENQIVRSARRRGIPVHVSKRPLVSDFTLLEFLERRPATLAA